MPALDQASLSIVSISIVVNAAHNMAAIDASRIILLFNVVLVMCAAIQALYFEPAMLVSDDEFRRVESAVALLVTPAVAGVGVIVAAAVWEWNWEAGLAVGLLIVAHLTLELCRWAGYRRRRPAHSVLIYVYVASTSTLLLVLQPESLTQTIWILGAIGASCGVAGLVGFRVPKRIVRPAAPNLLFGTDYALSMGAVSLFPVLISLFTSASSGAILRASQSLLGPVNILISAGRVAVLRGSSSRRATIVSISLSFVILGTLAILPERVLAIFLGEYAPTAKVVVVVLGVQLVILSAYFNAQYELRRLGMARSVLTVRVIGAAGTFLSAPLLVPLYGAGGAAWCLVIGSVLNLSGTVYLWSKRAVHGDNETE